MREILENKELLPDKEQNDAIEKEIRLEEARRKRVEAENKAANNRRAEEKRAARAASRDAASAFISGIPLKAKFILLAGVIIAVIVVFGVSVPVIMDDDQTMYLSTANLESAVEIDELSTVDYVYHGVAEKHVKFFWQDKIDYRVKYEAHIRAYYNLTEVRFKIDEESETVTAYIPKPEIAEPQLDDTKYGYLPEGASADLREVIALCKEDASGDVDKNEVEEQAEKSLKDTIRALTMPLLGEQYQLGFKPLAEYESDPKKDEKESDKDEKKAKDNEEAGNEE